MRSRKRGPDEITPSALGAGLAAATCRNLVTCTMPRDPKKFEGYTNFNQDFLKAIDQYGWYVMNEVPSAGEEGNAWAYSIGMFYHYKHPEIVVSTRQIGRASCR